MDELRERLEAQLLEYAQRIRRETKRQCEIAELRPTDYERSRKYRASVQRACTLYEGLYASARALHYVTGAGTYALMDAAKRLARALDEKEAAA